MSAKAAAGRFITFEGIEGAGKSTQLSRLAQRLGRPNDREVVVTREPGGTDLGQALRGLLLRRDGPTIAPTAELLLYAADRAQHVEETIRPALQRGAWVLCDRYVDATLAYQGGGRGLDLEWIQRLHRQPGLDLVPDRTLLFDLEPDTGLSRARARDAESGRAVEEGRFEAEALDFHRRVRAAYLELAAAAPQRFRIVDADGAIDAVAERVDEAMADWMPEVIRP